MLNCTEKRKYEKSLNVVYEGWIILMCKSNFTSDDVILQNEPVRAPNSDTNLKFNTFTKEWR
jgi:hypothetical protein